MTGKDAAEWGTVLLVIISGGMAGHFAAVGMDPLQWMGAIVAVLASVTAAVAVRVWPHPAKVEEAE